MIQPRINTQPIEKQQVHPNGFLEIHHVWDTIQGEGPFAGSPAVFVRLAGCNLDCRLCDTDYTSQRTLCSPANAVDLVNKAAGARKGLVVLTGGEPMRQSLGPFCQALLQQGYHVQIETNGTLWDESLNNLTSSKQSSCTKICIVCSPKAPKVHDEIAVRAMHFKYVLEADHVDDDGLPLTVLGTRLRPWRNHELFAKAGKTVYVQPVDCQDPIGSKLNRDAAVASCMEHGWRLALQLQKIIGLE